MVKMSPLRTTMSEPCTHPDVIWREGKYEPSGKHGPHRTRWVGGIAALRYWAICTCGMRLERVRVA